MRKTLFGRLLGYFVFYTALLVGVLYLIQRFLAPTFYLNRIVSDDQSSIQSIIDAYRAGATPLELSQIADGFEGDLSIYNAQGGVIYDESDEGPLRSIDVVRIFQAETLEQLTEDGRTYLEVYVAEDSEIFRLKTPFAPFVSNILLLNQFFIILVGVSLVLVIPLSYFFARSFTRPIVKLSQLAQSFAALEFEITQPSERPDEIGELSQTLETMAKRLSKTLNDLETELAKEKELDRLQKSFVARVSHEIKTPLAIIQAATETIQKYIPEDKRDYESMIIEEITRLSELTDDLIDLTQLESGRFKVRKSDLDLKPLIHAVIQSLSPLTERPIHLTGDTFTLDGDAKRITQVFRNLIKNALDHSDQAGPITVALDAKYRQVRITNPHSPIDEKTIERFGEPFYKPDESHAGRGLGLAITEQLLTLHQAQIHYEYDDKMHVKVQF